MTHFCSARHLAIFAVAASLAGCTAAPRSIMEIDVRDKEPACVRQCTTAYSSCVTGGIVQNNQLAACHDGYSACTSTCPRAAAK